MLAQVFALLAWEVRLEGLGNEEGGGGRGDWEGGIGEGVLEVSEGLEGAGDEEERYGLANIFPCGESGLLKISFSNRLGGPETGKYVDLDYANIHLDDQTFDKDVTISR